MCPGGGLASSSTTTAMKEPPASFRGQWHNGADYFKMPLHYPRYSRAQYEAMDEVQLDFLLGEYGLPSKGDVAEKRKDAMGHFLWS